MLKKSKQFNQSIKAIVMALSISIVHLVSIACLVDDSVELIANLLPQKSTHDSHGHHHSHSDHHHGSDSHHHSHEESNSEDEGCCKDEAVVYLSLDQFFSSISDFQFFSNYTGVLLPSNNNLISFNSQLEFYSDKRPPPNIRGKTSDVRVFIQSFQV